jgi:hypothetical protein
VGEAAGRVQVQVPRIHAPVYEHVLRVMISKVNWPERMVSFQKLRPYRNSCFTSISFRMSSRERSATCFQNSLIRGSFWPSLSRFSK